MYELSGGNGIYGNHLSRALGCPFGLTALTAILGLSATFDEFGTARLAKSAA